MVALIYSTKSLSSKDQSCTYINTEYTGACTAGHADIVYDCMIMVIYIL